MFDSALHFEDVLNIKLLLLFFSHSVVSDSATPWTAALQAFLSFTISQSLLKLMPVESVMPFNHLIFCHPLLLSSIFQSSIRVFSDESAFCNRQPKYWSFSISPSNEYSGLISFRIDWFARLNQGGKDVYHKNYITPTQGITEDTDIVCSCSGRLTMVKALSLSITWVDNIRGQSVMLHNLC